MTPFSNSFRFTTVRTTMNDSAATPLPTFSSDDLIATVDPFALPRPAILVVDDAQEVRDVLLMMLTNTGYEVEVAVDGNSGWAALSRRHFDLVITDYVMPNSNGIELLRRLRAHHPSLPVIMISGYSPWGGTDAALLLQPGLYLDKPFTFETLIHALADLLPHALPMMRRPGIG